MKSWGAFALVLASLLLASPPAAGQEAEVKGGGEHGKPWIRLQAERLAPEFRTALLRHVRSSLAARHIDACVSDEPSPSVPLATLEVTIADDGVATGIVVDDGVTRKRVMRDVDLRDIPPDGRAVTIALALDELLRASWAELLLPDAQPKTPTPQTVQDAILPPRVSPEAPPSPKTWEIGAALGGEHFGEGHDQLGADVVGRYARWSRVGFHARLGLRFAFPVQAPRGELRSTALALALGLNVALLPRSGRAGVDLFGEALLTRVTFVAEPSTAGVRGNEKAPAAIYAVTGTRAWCVLVSPLRAFVQIGGGVPLHTAYATDGDVRVTGLGGLLLLGQLGFSTVF